MSPALIGRRRSIPENIILPCSKQQSCTNLIIINDKIEGGVFCRSCAGSRNENLINLPGIRFIYLVFEGKIYDLILRMPVIWNHRSVKIDTKRKVKVFKFNVFKLGLLYLLWKEYELFFIFRWTCILIC